MNCSAVKLGIPKRVGIEELAAANLRSGRELAEGGDTGEAFPPAGRE